jgi:4-hydroxy-tetrahydrodipicolinate synthase
VPPVSDPHPPISGVWLPVVTPFLDGAIDYESFERLIGQYLTTGLSGIVALGTTGESPTLEPWEVEAIVDFLIEAVDGKLPVYVGIGGNSTLTVIQMVRRLERYPFAGILSVCPYYNRPTEAGIREHFRAIAGSTEKNLAIYNIPYRTGVNLPNDAVLELAEIRNIVGIKDCCASLSQSIDLLRQRPTGFSVLTGDDALFYSMLALGADGGILASAHYRPQMFVGIFERIRANDHAGAQALWSQLEPVVRLLFKEPNPLPVKHWLWRQRLLTSRECRLPMTRVSDSLARELESVLDTPGEHLNEPGETYGREGGSPVAEPRRYSSPTHGSSSLPPESRSSPPEDRGSHELQAL